MLCAIVFLPLDACDDGGKSWPSSFGQSIQIFRPRAGREKPTDDSTLFERVLVGLYGTDVRDFGRVSFFDVMSDPPRLGKPQVLKSFREAIDMIVDTYDSRNKTKFKWADGVTEILTVPDSDSGDDDET